MPNATKEDREWSEKVVEDFKESTENLPALDQLSGFDQRVVHGIALINAGATVAAAAREVGVEYMQLMDRYKGKVKNAPVEVKEQQEAIIRDQAVEGVIKGQQRIIEMLDDERMKPAEVVKAVQTLRDTVKTLDNWDARGTGGGNKTADILGGLVREVLKKVPDADPVEKAIEIDAESANEGSE